MKKGKIFKSLLKEYQKIKESEIYRFNSFAHIYYSISPFVYAHKQIFKNSVIILLKIYTYIKGCTPSFHIKIIVKFIQLINRDK